MGETWKESFPLSIERPHLGLHFVGLLPNSSACSFKGGKTNSAHRVFFLSLPSLLPSLPLSCRFFFFPSMTHFDSTSFILKLGKKTCVTES